MQDIVTFKAYMDHMNLIERLLKLFGNFKNYTADLLLVYLDFLNKLLKIEFFKRIFVTQQLHTILGFFSAQEVNEQISEASNAILAKMD
jgi:hypothetical protein